MSAAFSIRPGRADDFRRLQSIEIDAFETLFAAGGVHGEASSSTEAELQRYIDAGLLLVAADEGDQPIGYVGAIFADGWLHVSEIDVARLAAQRRRPCADAGCTCRGQGTQT